MPSVFYETTRRIVSLALRVIDDVTAKQVTSAKVKLRNARYSRKAFAKNDGFYVFTDMVPGTYELLIEADGYDAFTQSVDLPLPGTPVLNVPGENEVLLSATNSNTSAETVEFAPRNFFTAAPDGTSVITSRRISVLADPLEGESVSMATLDEVGSGVSRIRRRDVLRLVGERVVRLRPAPHYRFDDRLLRLSGAVRDGANGSPIAGATVTLSRIGTRSIDSEDVGTTPGNTVRVYTIGTTTATKRVVGVGRDVIKSTNSRGQYVFHFPERIDLTVDQVTVDATAPGYTPATPVDVNLTANVHTVRNFDLNRI